MKDIFKMSLNKIASVGYLSKSLRLKSRKDVKDKSFSTKTAFTLAEVLITLGIIGIVAAMTIPTLINNYQKKATVTSLQKVYSVLNQTFKTAQLEMGESSSWGDPSINSNPAASKDWWDTYFLPHSNLSIIKTCSGTDIYECWANTAKWLDGKTFNYGSNYYCLILKDGSAVMLYTVSTIWDNGRGIIWVDTNGLKKPNIVGKDIFQINLSYKLGKISFDGKGQERTMIMRTGDAGCSKSDSGNFKGQWCGALIQQDGWQIKDDYPWN